MSILINSFIFENEEETFNRSLSVDDGFNYLGDEPGVDDTGVVDSTAAINTAILRIKDARKVTYFGPDTEYLVSDTILCEMVEYSSHTSNHTYILLGSKIGTNRPKITLADNSSGFNDPNNPKPVIRYVHYKSDGMTEDANVYFGQGFRGIDIDLGSGNAGAVGIHMNAAEDSFLEDVKVTATNAFAGFTALPGRGSNSQNLEVIGGQHIIHLNYGSLGANIVDLKGAEQTDNPLYIKISRAISIVGFEIVGSNTPLMDTFIQGAEIGNVTLCDGTYELTTPGIGIDNTSKAFVGLRSVYFKNASTIIDSNTDSLAGNSSGWIKVDRYAYAPESFASVADAGYHLVDGEFSQRQIAEVSGSGTTPPQNIRSKHSWSGGRAYESDWVEWITDHGAVRGQLSDVAINAAISAAEASGRNSVFIPDGTFGVLSSVIPKAHTQMLGVPGRRSIIAADNSWTPAQREWVIDTPNESNGTFVLEHVVQGIPEQANSMLGYLRWRVGRNSVFRTARGGTSADLWLDTAKHTLQIEGGGGGRFYGLSNARHFHWGGSYPSDANLDSRRLYISGTTEPLSFYGFCINHPSASARANNGYLIEIINSANIRIFGSKIETAGEWLLVKNSDNIALHMLMAVAGHSTYDLIVVEGTTNMEVFLAMWRNGLATSAQIREIGYGHSNFVSRENMQCLYRRGTLNWNTWG